MGKQIIVKIDLQTGELSTEASGFKGATCIKDTEKLLEGISATIKNRRFKAEHNAVATGNKIGIQG